MCQSDQSLLKRRRNPFTFSDYGNPYWQLGKRRGRITAGYSEMLQLVMVLIVFVSLQVKHTSVLRHFIHTNLGLFWIALNVYRHFNVNRYWHINFKAFGHINILTVNKQYHCKGVCVEFHTKLLCCFTAQSHIALIYSKKKTAAVLLEHTELMFS